MFYLKILVSYHNILIFFSLLGTSREGKQSLHNFSQDNLKTTACSSLLNSSDDMLDLSSNSQVEALSCDGEKCSGNLNLKKCVIAVKFFFLVMFVLKTQIKLWMGHHAKFTVVIVLNYTQKLDQNIIKLLFLLKYLYGVMPL